jgi:sugar phosphate isomerase/epimerase
MKKIAKEKLLVQLTYQDLLDKLWLVSFFRINCELYVSPDRIDSCLDSPALNRIKSAFSSNSALAHREEYPEGIIGEIHLSDNLGDRDAHMPLGAGNIDFSKVFDALSSRQDDPFYTIEAKDIWGVIGGIRYLKRIGAL